MYLEKWNKIDSSFFKNTFVLRESELGGLYNPIMIIPYSSIAQHSIILVTDTSFGKEITLKLVPDLTKTATPPCCELWALQK